jgi:hypothetical protein
VALQSLALWVDPTVSGSALAGITGTCSDPAQTALDVSAAAGKLAGPLPACALSCWPEPPALVLAKRARAGVERQAGCCSARRCSQAFPATCPTRAS